jgi:hypothetical protein
MYVIKSQIHLVQFLDTNISPKTYYSLHVLCYIHTVYLQQYIVLNLLYLSYHVFCEKYEYIEHSRVSQRLRAFNYEKPRGNYVLLK